ADVLIRGRGAGERMLDVLDAAREIHILDRSLRTPVDAPDVVEPECGLDRLRGTVDRIVLDLVRASEIRVLFAAGLAGQGAGNEAFASLRNVVLAERSFRKCHRWLSFLTVQRNCQDPVS